MYYLRVWFEDGYNKKMSANFINSTIEKTVQDAKDYFAKNPSKKIFHSEIFRCVADKKASINFTFSFSAGLEFDLKTQAYLEEHLLK